MLLDQELHRICEEHGWSYPGTPAALVDRLFKTIAIREDTIKEVRGELLRWDRDVREALGVHAQDREDPVATIRRLANAEAPEPKIYPPGSVGNGIQRLFRRFVDRARGW